MPSESAMSPVSEATQRPADPASPPRKISLLRWISRGVLLLIIALLVALLLQPRLTVTLRNSGTSSMNSVRLIVTGSQTYLGDLAAGAEHSARIFPRSESNLELEYQDETGETRRLDAGGYFGRRTSGQINVDIRDGKVIGYTEDTRL